MRKVSYRDATGTGSGESTTGSCAVPDLSAAECETASGSRYWGSWLLVFSQP